MTFEQLRRQYTLGGLHESEMDPDPIQQFHDWMKTALENLPAAWVEPHAMTLSTASRDGTVAGRIVLLRGADARGFVFYSNYDSPKGQNLIENPNAALTFYWGYLERQVRIEGKVSRIERARAELYFHQRPRGSQLSAVVSAQSSVIPDRETLEQEVAKLAARLGDAPVPMPENWGGFCLEPQSIEFWQGRENRLHDRLAYHRSGDSWKLVRLAP